MKRFLKQPFEFSGHDVTHSRGIPVRSHHNEVLESCGVPLLHRAHEGFGRGQWRFIDKVIVEPKGGGSRSKHSDQKKQRKAFALLHRKILRCFRCSPSTYAVMYWENIMIRLPIVASSNRT